MPIITDILINDKSWGKENPNLESYLQDLINNVIPSTKLNKLLKQGIEIEISVVLSNDNEIQNLNKTYRKIDKPTNVLSFPAINPQDFDNELITENFIAIGDIILSFETIKRECKEQNKTFNNHLVHLLIHSILHLIGYDHKTDLQAKEMEDLEIELLKKLEIDNPYIIN